MVMGECEGSGHWAKFFYLVIEINVCKLDSNMVIFLAVKPAVNKTVMGTAMVVLPQ